MAETEKKERVRSLSANKYDIEINNPFMDCRVFWARVVRSENESLFTQYTKHTFYEIQYALEGHIGMKIGKDEGLYVAESDFVVIPPDVYHQVVDADSRGARFIMAFSFMPKVGKMQDIAACLDSGKPCRETPRMRAQLSLILDRSSKNSESDRRTRQLLLECFLLEMFEALKQKGKEVYSDGIDEACSGNRERVDTMLDFIRGFNGIGVGVSELSERFNISERHINRLFKSVLGKSPKEVINHEKLKKIEEYIVSTRLSFCEIAELCGFCDEYAMNKFFKRYNLTNVSDFRRIAKQKD